MLGYHQIFTILLSLYSTVKSDSGIERFEQLETKFTLLSKETEELYHIHEYSGSIDFGERVCVLSGPEWNRLMNGTELLKNLEILERQHQHSDDWENAKSFMFLKCNATQKCCQNFTCCEAETTTVHPNASTTVHPHHRPPHNGLVHQFFGPHQPPGDFYPDEAPMFREKWNSSDVLIVAVILLIISLLILLCWRFYRDTEPKELETRPERFELTDLPHVGELSDIQNTFSRATGGKLSKEERDTINAQLVHIRNMAKTVGESGVDSLKEIKVEEKKEGEIE